MISTLICVCWFLIGFILGKIVGEVLTENKTIKC